MLVSLVVAFLALGCGIIGSPKPTSPCPGLYCIEVDIASVPGAPELCYSSIASRDEAVAYYEKQGAKINVRK